MKMPNLLKNYPYICLLKNYPRPLRVVRSACATFAVERRAAVATATGGLLAGGLRDDPR